VIDGHIKAAAGLRMEEAGETKFFHDGNSRLWFAFRGSKAEKGAISPENDRVVIYKKGIKFSYSYCAAGEGTYDISFETNRSRPAFGREAEISTRL
jgi:hypothetical protein